MRASRPGGRPPTVGRRRRKGGSTSAGRLGGRLARASRPARTSPPDRPGARARDDEEHAPGTPPGWRARLSRYHRASRDIGRSLALVVPLLLAYELTMSVLAPPVRNSAELAVDRLLARLPSHIVPWLHWLALAALLLSTWLWLRRERAREAPAALVLGESLLLALALGPAVGGLVGGVGLSVDSSVSQASPPWLPYLLSLGAGLWEEIVFRLGLLGGLVVVLARLTPCTERAALVLAVLLSALGFALYHHLGASGEPFEARRFAFRAVAGTILGLLFVVRGFAVVVYMHVFYDLLCDLRAA